MHNKPLISVIVYINNFAEHLKKCLDTLIFQMYDNVEIICVCDKSILEDISELYAYKSKSNRIEILYSENSNAAKAWNVGMNVAKGDYVHFININTWLLLDFYKVFADCIQTADADIWIFNAALHSNKFIDIPYYEFFDSDDIIKNSVNNIYSYRDINHIMTKNLRVLNKLYKKQFLKDNDIKFDESNIYSEYMFNMETLVKSEFVYINPEVYIRSTEQYIKEGIYTEKVFDIFDMITKLQNFLISKDILKQYVFDFFNYICNSLDKYYDCCPNTLRFQYFNKMKEFALSRFYSMPPEVQKIFKDIEDAKNFLFSSFEEYNTHKK